MKNIIIIILSVLFMNISGTETRNEITTLLKMIGLDVKCVNTALDECKKSFKLDNKLDSKSYKEVGGLLQKDKISPECVLKSLYDCYSGLVSIDYNALAYQASSCADLSKRGDRVSGLKTIYPWKQYNDIPVTVYCDQDTDGGGWTVIQRRQPVDKREDFYRTWIEYKLGFGDKNGEYWLGNDLIHEMTSLELQQLRVDLEDYDNNKRWAKYGYFYVNNESHKYRLSIGRYNKTSTGGDSLTNATLDHNSQMFSTPDRDNDESPDHCSVTYKGPWWHRGCHYSNLNGHQYEGHHDSFADGINWMTWLGYHYSLKSTKVMIKPAF